jgi:hypothetical protein
MMRRSQPEVGLLEGQLFISRAVHPTSAVHDGEEFPADARMRQDGRFAEAADAAV